MSDHTKEHLKKLAEYFDELGSAAIAFSGGVDSAVLLSIAHERLKSKAVAVTANSASVPSRDLKAARDFCAKRGIVHEIVETDEFKDHNYLSNPENRCYFCKLSIFDNIRKAADKRGLKFIIEGTNASELTGHRPGFQAKKDRKDIATPFADLGLTKDDVRALARELKLEVAEKPSTACLSSRIPTGVRIEPEVLRRIDIAENFLMDLGVKQVRVRHHDTLARIESDANGMNICVEHGKEICDKMRALGWKNVTLDLEGYRTGGGR